MAAQSTPPGPPDSYLPSLLYLDSVLFDLIVIYNGPPHVAASHFGLPRLLSTSRFFRTPVIGYFHTPSYISPGLCLLFRTMGRQFRTYLAGEIVFCCRQCGNHLAVVESVMSRVSPSTVLLPLGTLSLTSCQGIQRTAWQSDAGARCVS